jgi:hypothetical protein
MKTFLIVAGVLMTGASVYGVVDYNNKINTTEFKELYKEEHSTEHQVVTHEKTAPFEFETPVKSEVEKMEVSKTDVVRKASKPKPVVKKKKKREFSIKEFSRAPLDEKYLKKTLKYSAEKNL